MKYIPDILMAIGTCALGIVGSDFLNLQEQRNIRLFALVVSILLIISGVFGFFYQAYAEKKKQKKENALFIKACKKHLSDGNYEDVVNLLILHGLTDAKSNMIYGYLLCYGYGINQDVAEGIKYYMEAKRLGEKRAYDNLIIYMVKNCCTTDKIDYLRKAYQEKNNIAIHYTKFIVDGLHSDPASNHSQITPDELWCLNEQELMNILNKPVYTWVGSNASYNVSMSTVSTPNFTRRYLYQTGTTRVYEEKYRVIKCYDAVLPLGNAQWLQEKLW